MHPMVTHDMTYSLMAVAAVIAGPILFVRGFHAMRIRRMIQNTPTSHVRSMAMGLVELSGKVAARSRVAAPFSGRSCAYWEIEIAVRSANTRNGVRRWSTVHRNHSGHPFYLDDGTGTALVYPQGAECRLNFGVEEETYGLGVPEPYHGYMEQQGLSLRTVWALGPMRFRERVVEEDAIVFVLGRAYPKASSKAVSWDEETLQATGTDSAGVSSVRVHDEQLRGVIRRGPDDPVLLLSQRSEKAMTFEYGLKAFAELVGAPLLTLFGVWCLLELARSGQLFR